MNLYEFLCQKQISIEEVVATAKSKGQLIETDILLVVGSLSEGLATLKSDFDLILITERDINSISDKKSISWVVGSCLVDMEIKKKSTVLELTSRFNTWVNHGWDKAFSADFTPEERKLLHRYLNGIFLDDDNNAKRNEIVQFNKEQLAKLKLHSARHTSRTIQVDMVGHKLSKDFRSLAYASIELLGHATDALLAASYLTNPLVKWRSRLLGTLLDNGISQINSKYVETEAADLIWYLHTLPESEPQAILSKAEEVVHYCRLMFLYAELKLVYPELLSSFHQIKQVITSNISRDDSKLLPCLELDVDFHIDDGEIYMARLNEFGEVIQANLAEFSLALQFDGLALSEEALRGVYPEQVDDKERAVLNNLISKFHQANLFSESPFSE
ncbi:hypothetical protein Sden_1160 [Shewanella denitrificans OS217]|jgi:hypothetical protein|uniref:Uncharacterized protein n=1 Tax=Shewanella denitrificans (strain OS217 / ATCC BAA-1090 / DSM 15013) TaxID=318161 RepID=Q12Q30_SHEDO|nr:hypothetical protein [Shewanella denitrificans]ABE54446.1 hypothetical protein Sden_1160 [Shewanella denitrificans OS217]